MEAARWIAHLDMDCFFAAVEERDDPSLVGRPVLVAGEGPRAVVATANYQARGFGVASAMPLSRAKRLCPHATVLRPRPSRYREASEEIRSVLERWSSAIEQVSLDEAYLDLSSFGTEARRTAAFVRADVRRQTGLTASLGLATSKLVAKLACALAKPDGMFVVEAGGERSFLWPLKIRQITGVGPATAQRLEAVGIHTVGDLASIPDSALVGAVGERSGRWLAGVVRGEDPRPVVVESEAKQVSSETTFWDDLHVKGDLERELARLVLEVSRRLAHSGRSGRSVSVKLRWDDFSTRTRSVTLSAPTDSAVLIGDAGRKLLLELLDEPAGRRGVRLLGVAVTGLTHGSQDTLFSGQETLFSGQETLFSGQETSLFGIGRKVSHGVFGAGLIVWSDGETAAVRFSDGRVRDLDLAVANLEVS